MTNQGKHLWKYSEDKLCCKRYLEYFVLSKMNMSNSDFILVLQKELPNISIGSLRMKIQNIKQILLDNAILDTLNISPLANYSVQNKRAMDELLKEMRIN